MNEPPATEVIELRISEHCLAAARFWGNPTKEGMERLSEVLKALALAYPSEVKPMVDSVASDHSSLSTEEITQANPARLITYLKKKGWSEFMRDDTYTTWVGSALTFQPLKNGTGMERRFKNFYVPIPTAKAPDFHARMHEALETLSDLECRSPSEIVSELLD